MPSVPARPSVWVKTVTTLGATFSATGAKVVIIPSRVCCGCCAMTGDRLVVTHKTVRANRRHDLRVPFSINSLLAEKNRTHSRSRLFFDLVSRSESGPYASVATSPVAPSKWNAAVPSDARYGRGPGVGRGLAVGIGRGVGSGVVARRIAPKLPTAVPAFI